MLSPKYQNSNTQNFSERLKNDAELLNAVHLIQSKYYVSAIVEFLQNPLAEDFVNSLILFKDKKS